MKQGWQLAATAPGGGEPGAAEWREARVPGTVAQCVPPPFDYDAYDWWYRTTFTARPGTRQRLRFEGLATLATVWLNGVEILSSRNMFMEHAVDVSALCRDVNQLVIVFRSLRGQIAQRRPRPRWKTRLVAEQNLRWLRTSLLGRMPGWTPPVPPIGPWRPISLESGNPGIHAWLEGSVGRVRVSGETRQGRLIVGDQACELTADLRIEDVPLWWPHTHGAPTLLPCVVEFDDGERIDCGRIGFKRVEYRDGFVVNGERLFCRGACWMPDLRSLDSDPAELRRTLEMARDAGVNMLRISGTTIYEPSEFYRLCDELGILVWQDFMFANMDYPVADSGFRALVETEARQQLERLRRHPCIAAYCGGSEVAQQAAMLGLPASHWTNDFFAASLPRLCDELHPGIPYFPSTPWGGALPFHVGTGIAHYYGVGAYRRPLTDVKTARVKFAAECLAFANIPEEGSPDAGVPRDNGASWDFADVREHYRRALFQGDDGQLAASRVAPGEVMQRVFAEWRSPASSCAGGLVWFLKDLVPGSGWGVLDCAGNPKASWWYLKRAWATRTLFFTDEGLDGLFLHVINEHAEPLAGSVELRFAHECFRRPVSVAPRSNFSISCDEIIGCFTDHNAAYRFGPPKYSVIAARLLAADESVIADDFWFPAGHSLPRVSARLAMHAEWQHDRVALTLQSPVFLQAVRIVSPGFLPDDNYFHVAAKLEKRIIFTGKGDFEARIEALNLLETPSVRATREVHELA